jgi:hypothetical protein
MNISLTEFYSSMVQDFENKGGILFTPLMKCYFPYIDADILNIYGGYCLEFHLKRQRSIVLIDRNPFTALSKVVEDKNINPMTKELNLFSVEMMFSDT